MSYTSEVLADDPIAWWRFHESAGSVVVDSSGKGNHGSFTGTPLFGQAGAIPGDTSIWFDGSSSAVGGSGSPYDITTGAAEVWANLDPLGGSWTSFRSLVVKQFAFGMFLNDGILGFYDWGGGTFRSSGLDIRDNKWHHLVLNFENSVVNGSTLYLDNNLVLTDTVVFTSSGVAYEVARNPAAQVITGYLDEPALYGAKLTPTRISTHYAARWSGNRPTNVPTVVVGGGRW